MQSRLKVESKRTYFIAIFFSAVFIASNFIFILYASYPGYLYPDSVNQLIQIFTGKFDDWHPPFSTLVLYATHTLIPGPFGYVILVNMLVWGSFAMLVYAKSQRIGAWALVLLVIPYLPGAYNMLGNVHKDVLLVAWLLAGSVIGYLANRDDVRPLQKPLYLIFANLLMIAAFLTRPNAIFAIIPLLIYINHSFGWRRNLIIGVSMLILMPLMHVVLLKLTQAEEFHPGDSIKTYQLLGLSYLEGRNLFPGEWSDEQARKIAEVCYTSVQWDTAAFWGKCGFIHKELKRQKIWGSGKLTKVWLSGVINNPLAIFSLMSASFYKSIYDPNSLSMFYNPAMPKLFHWEVKMDPPRRASRLVHKYVNSHFNNRLGRPFLFAVIAVVALTLLTCTQTTINSDGLFAVAILCSGLLNLLSYFILTVSAEYRYFYWSCFAVYLGFGITILSLVVRNKGIRGVPLGNWLKKGVFALLAICIGLVAASKPFPPIDRTVSLTPLDESDITLKTLRRASIPNWMGIRIHGDLSPHGWRMDEKGQLHGNNSNGTLMTTIPTQGKAIEIEMMAGRDKGRVLVDSDGFSEVVDLSASSKGSKVVYLWPTPAYGIKHNHTLWSAPVMALLYGLFSIWLLYWIDIRFLRAR